MREEKLVDAMSFLDEELIEYTNEVRQGKACKEAKKEEPLWMKWRKEIAIIAAVFLVSLGLSNLITENKGELIYGEFIDSDAGSGVIHSYDDLSIVNSASPWMGNDVFIPATLPVYRNLSYHLAGEPSGLTNEQMLDLIKETTDALGLELTQIEKEVNPRNPEAIFYYYTDIGNTRIEVEADGLITINFKDGIEVKKDFSKAYFELLNFEEPVITESLEGNYVVFDGKGTLEEDMLNYFFSYAEFYTNETDKLSMIRIHNNLLAAEKLGDYFYISEAEAKEKLYKGEFYTYSGYGLYEDSPIANVELVYINSRLQKHFLPYYCFYVEVEDEGLLKEYKYGLFYVPAVDLETSKKLQ